MAKYLARAAPSLAAGKILLIVKASANMVDYQSVLTLIGLKQVFGTRVTVAFPIDYIYSDWAGASEELYGRGFGYTRVLAPSLRNGNEVRAEEVTLSSDYLSEFETIVVGSVTRNSRLARKLLLIHPAAKTVWIHGEDHEPAVDEVEEYRRLGVAVFARELSAGLAGRGPHG